MSSGFVLDNSVTMRWCFEDNSAYAVHVLQEMHAGQIAHVPALWLYEVISVMAEAQRGGTLSTEEARGFFEDLRSLDIDVDSAIEREHLFGAAHRLAVEHGLTGYDAAYLELAIRKGLPLASLDRELNKAAVRAGVSLMSPGVSSF